MNCNRIIFKRLWLPVFIVFITIFISNTLFAGPAPKCPCFSSGEIERAISKADTTLFPIACNRFTGDYFVGGSYGETYTDMKIAEIYIPTSTGGTLYSMFGNLEYQSGTQYPSCGVMEAVYDVGSDGYWIDGTGTIKVTMNEFAGEYSAEVMLACYNAILEAYPTCNVSAGGCGVIQDCSQ